MNPEDLVKELVHQNKLLRETIPFLVLSVTHNEDYRIINAREDPEKTKSTEKQEESETNTNRPMMTTTTRSSHLTTASWSSNNSDSQAAIETLLNLLDRQESRLDWLERFGKSVLLQPDNVHHIPVFRGLKQPCLHPIQLRSPITLPTSKIIQRQQDDDDEDDDVDEEEGVNEMYEQEMPVHEWTRKIMEHINKIKSFNPTSTKYETKEIIKFIYDKLDLEPLEFLKSLLKKNQDLVLNQFPNEIPIQFISNNNNNDTTHINLNETSLKFDVTSVDLLFLFPFKLYLLRHPKALLNTLNSKF